jgi:maltodextrin utilization protein YvdJ
VTDLLTEIEITTDRVTEIIKEISLNPDKIQDRVTEIIKAHPDRTVVSKVRMQGATDPLTATEITVKQAARRLSTVTTVTAKRELPAQTDLQDLNKAVRLAVVLSKAWAQDLKAVQGLRQQ